MTYSCPKIGHNFGDTAGMPSSLQLRPADIFGEVCIYPAGLAFPPFVLTLFFVGGDEAEILRCAQRARCPVGPGIKGKGKSYNIGPSGR